MGRKKEMPEFVVFARKDCNSCINALKLIRENILAPNDLRVFYLGENLTRDDWNTLPGHPTFPQIIFRDILIGGYDDLVAFTASPQRG